MDATAWMTWLLVLVTGGVIWWQGQQLRKQLELQTLTDLFKEWENMKEIRSEIWSVSNPDTVDEKELDKVEGVLEYLEKIGSYYKNKVLSLDLIWDTAFGWYILRYYYYYQKAIPRIREKWGDDNTLYTDIEDLYKDLSKRETQRRGINECKLNESLNLGKDKFKNMECNTP